jgi:glycosyltransferase involved in cell wall biosynthesis
VPNMLISVIIPVYDEVESIPDLLREIGTALSELPHEVICVDDGSRDGSFAAISEAANADQRVRGIRLARNFGQTAALMAGMDAAMGNIIVSIDGDGQNDPADIPRMVELLDEGYDVVSGWRTKRRDSFGRVAVSRAANWIASRVAGVRLHDFGCTLKAYRRDVLVGVRLYGELHRFVPIFSSWEGGRITEVSVNHRQRLRGKSKYGYGRVVKVVLDLILIRYLYQYMHRPLHVFGGVGLSFILLGIASGVFSIWLKLIEKIHFIKTPLPLLAVTLTGLGLISVMMGLLAEIVVRTYYESQDRKSYLVREVTFGQPQGTD